MDTHYLKLTPPETLLESQLESILLSLLEPEELKPKRVLFVEFSEYCNRNYHEVRRMASDSRAVEKALANLERNKFLKAVSGVRLDKACQS